jgi:DNA replication initiation complex subunit (GINS family)
MITFQSIRDVERAERDSKKLQRLPEEWNIEVQKYLEMKEAVQEKSPEDLLEIQNVKGILQRLLDLREKKLIDQALIAVRTGAPPENLLKAEEQLFWAIAESLKRFRAEWMAKPRDRTTEKKYAVKMSAGPFVGPDMETYEVKEGQTISLPPTVAEVLAKQGIIEEI